MHRRHPRRPAPPTGTAKPGGTISTRCSCVAGCVGMAASPGAVASVRATAVTGWKPQGRLRSVGPWAGKACAGLWGRGRPLVVGPWGWASHAAWAAGRWTRAPGPAGRRWKRGGANHWRGLAWSSSPGGRRPRSPANGTVTAWAVRWRGQTVPGAWRRSPCAVSWGRRVNGRNRTRRPLPQPKRRQPRRSSITCGRGTPGGVRVRRRPKRRSRRLSPGDRAGEAAGPRPGGRRPYALGSWPPPATRGGRGGDVPPRRPHHRERPASAL